MTQTPLSRIDGVELNAIAQRFGTPCYVYSRAALTAATLSRGRPVMR
jgi:diaminopimelate decarboxylase